MSSSGTYHLQAHHSLASSHRLFLDSTHPVHSFKLQPSHHIAQTNQPKPKQTSKMKNPGETSPDPAKGAKKAPGKDLPTSKSNQTPLLSLKAFRFPTETGNSNPDAPANASNGLLATDSLESTLAAPNRETTKTMDSSKTKASRCDKTKEFLKRVVLKIRDLLSRAKAKAQKGKKKLTPKIPVLRLKVELDNPARAVSGATSSPVGQPPCSVAAESWLAALRFGLRV